MPTQCVPRTARHEAPPRDPGTHDGSPSNLPPIPGRGSDASRTRGSRPAPRSPRLAGSRVREAGKLARGAPLSAPVRRRLIGDAAVIATIRHAGQRFAAAEEEIRLAGVSDRPVAFFVVELDERAALSDRDDIFDQLRLWLGIVFVGEACSECGIAAYRGPHTAEQMRG